ncbi:alpha/beta fold hydrolase [Bradyrhizobium sp. dw_78]|uniref:alpha/beta hydrolase n=1 Tax=Bradyrhizobium sp. dw_78 TaxID=2719793 RepID=UPI001BD448E5|nr:alpha/beta fold hydrolase [Bradyrhizobium sp. dw_78]
MTVLKWLIVFAVIGYLGTVTTLFFTQRAFVFPVPQRVRTALAAAGFPEAQEHVLTTADGEKIIVWHVPAKPGHAVVLYFPGNGDYLAGSVGRFRGIVSDGTGLVALSYRGYAGSSGQPSEQGLLQDAAAAYAFVAERYKAGQIAVWGFSLGTGVAVALAAAHPVARLILEAPYTSIADVAAARPLFRWVPVRWLLRDQFRSDERITAVTAPLLIMHGGRDSVVPIGFGERLFALAHQPKQFVRFAEGGHDNLDNYGAIEATRHFLDASNG